LHHPAWDTTPDDRDSVAWYSFLRVASAGRSAQKKATTGVVFFNENGLFRF
jgi:hypothetical protein